MSNEKIYQMELTKIYPLLVNKAQRKRQDKSRGG